jgi:hypothetical protein
MAFEKGQHPYLPAAILQHVFPAGQENLLSAHCSPATAFTSFSSVDFMAGIFSAQGME